MDSTSLASGGNPGTSGEKFDINHAKGLYVSFFAYTFDILSFIALTFVANTVAEAIYPSTSYGISLLIFWGGFAAGSLTRPLGAAIFGKDTDAKGRKRSLYITILGASLFTALLAATPTYAQVGVLSPVIFIALRLIGGIFIGGLIAGGLVFGPENFPERFRGLMTGFAESGGSWAHVIGAAWLLMISLVFVGTAYATVGWRVMFLVSILPLAIILPVLYKTPESNIYKLARKRGKVTGSPLQELMVKKSPARRTFYLSLLMSVGLLGYDNLTENGFPAFLGKVNHLPHPTIAVVVLVGAAAGVIGSILGGYLSQKTGRRPIALVGGVILILISYLYIHLGSLPNTAVTAIMLTLMPMYFFASISKADFSLFLNESFPTRLRGSGVGLNWNLGYGLAGLWPIIVSAFLVYFPHSFPELQAISIAILGVMYLIGAVLSKETVGNISKEKMSFEEESS